MYFAFTDDQLAMRDAVRDLLARECGPDVVRGAWPEPDQDGQGPGAGARATPAKVEGVWQQLVDMGVPGLLVAEEHGGMGFDEVVAMLVLEETGYAAVPHPVVETVCVTAPLLASAGRDDDLVDVMAGKQFAVSPPFGDLIMWSTHAERVMGIRKGAVAADRALTWSAGVVGLGDHDRLATSVDTIDGSLGVARLVDPFVSDEVFLGVDVARAFDRAALGTAAQLVGLSRRMIDLTVAYVTERKQFGVPIGSFQAVKHHLADARLQLEFARPTIARAAWSLATGDATAARDVSMAKAMAGKCAHVVGRKALQCHGGIGYTVEYDLHLYLKRALALKHLWGDGAWHRARVGRAIGV